MHRHHERVISFEDIELINDDIYSINMYMYGIISFEWDGAKSSSNEEKHGVTFEEASTVFYDPFAVLVPDDEHSYDEERFIILGISMKARTLIVCHCYKQTNELIRIISARQATKTEENDYWRRRHEG